MYRPFMIRHKANFITAASFLLLSLQVGAQDTLKKREVNITSTFKPTLKEAAKMNITASPAQQDTSKPRLQYNIPNQNLVLAFQPGSLKPLALAVDTGGKWDNESYVKLGYGSLKTPFLQVGGSIGDGRTMGLNVYAQHYSSKGKLPLQENMHTNLDVNAFFRTHNKLEWNARIGGEQNRYNKYGFLPKTLVFPYDSVKVRLQNWSGRIAMHNMERTGFGLYYAPEFKIDVLSDQLDNKESNTYINLPLQKTIGTTFEANVSFEASRSQYQPVNRNSVTNTWVSFSPALSYKKNFLVLQAGIRPTWNNGAFQVLPNIMAEVRSADNRFSFQAGWLGYIRTSGFQYLTRMNPWIWAPSMVNNTRIEERYAGFKGTVGDHFSFGGKLALNKINNQPLFVNDTASGKSFLVLNEPEMNVVNFGGELGYTVGEKFSLISNISLNRYKMKTQAEAWGLLPMEWTTTLRLQVLKDLYVNSTIYAFDGPQSIAKATGKKDLPGAMDLSAGLEFRVVKYVKIWAQFNNIMNNEYQRWNQYPSYGFNFLGGVVFSLAQKK